MANSYSGGFAPSSRSGKRGGLSGGTIKLLGLLGLVGVGAAIAFARKPGDLVSAKSGKTWRVVLVSNTGGVKTYELFSPASSFGPHEELSVLRYTQMGSDSASRKIVGVGQGVPEVMVSTAASDFGLPFDRNLLPS